MKAALTWILSVGSLLWGLATPAGSAGLTDDHLSPLKGLGPAFTLVVADLSEEALAADLRPEGLRAELADGLARLGGREQDPAPAQLRVEVHDAYLRAAGLFAYSVELSLREEVALARDRSVRLQTATWRRITVGTALRSNLDRAVVGALRGLLEAFVNDYLLMNPPG